MAAVDYFLKVDGIPGESTDAKHKAEIDLESYSLGASNTASFGKGGGGGSGKVQFGDFSFTMKTSKASPKLMLACATGEHLKKATLTCRKAGKEQQEYMIVTLSDCLITSYQTGGSESGGIANEQVSLGFAKIEIEYKEQKPDGTLGGATKAGYDVQANKKL